MRRTQPIQRLTSFLMLCLCVDKTYANEEEKEEKNQWDLLLKRLASFETVDANADKIDNDTHYIEYSMSKQISNIGRPKQHCRN